MFDFVTSVVVFVLFLGLSLCIAGKLTENKTEHTLTGLVLKVVGCCITSAWLIAFIWCQLNQ